VQKCSFCGLTEAAPGVRWHSPDCCPACHQRRPAGRLITHCGGCGRPVLVEHFTRPKPAAAINLFKVDAGDGRFTRQVWECPTPGCGRDFFAASVCDLPDLEGMVGWPP